MDKRNWKIGMFIGGVLIGAAAATVAFVRRRNDELIFREAELRAKKQFEQEKEETCCGEEEPCDSNENVTFDEPCAACGEKEENVDADCGEETAPAGEKSE